MPKRTADLPLPARRFLERRQALGKSMAQVAAEAGEGLKLHNINDLERGKTPFSSVPMPRLEGLARALEMEPWALLQMLDLVADDEEAEEIEQGYRELEGLAGGLKALAPFVHVIQRLDRPHFGGLGDLDSPLRQDYFGVLSAHRPLLPEGWVLAVVPDDAMRGVPGQGCKAGDVVAVDTTQGELIPGKVYALRNRKGMVFLRRYRALEGTSWFLPDHADNERYPAFRQREGQNAYEVLGAVVKVYRAGEDL